MIVIVSLLSTALSIAPGISLWGRNPASFEAGEYTALRRALVFAAIAIILEAWQLAYEYDKKAFDANPLELTNHYRLAFSAWELGKLGDNEKQIEAVELYVRLTGLAPADGLAAERLETLRNVLSP
jgi:hypothetical protein